MENQPETLIPVKRRLSNLLSEDGCELKITYCYHADQLKCYEKLA